MNIKDLIKNNPKSIFEYYRKGELYYSAGNFTFRVPVDDTGDGSFKAKMRTIELMRWVRIELAEREKESAAVG